MATKKITELTTVSAVTDDLYFPSDDGIQSYKASGAQLGAYLLPSAGLTPVKVASSLINKPTNYAFTAAVGSNALTVALKSAAGTDASSTDVIKIPFRHATLTNGTPVVVNVTGALSVVVSSGSTLGHRSATDHWIYLYAINNAGTVELAVSSSPNFDNGSVQSTTAEGGAGAADSAALLYSTTSRSNVAVTLLGRMKSQQATAGTWATAIAELSVLPFDRVCDSEVYVEVGNGHGSTNTKIRRYSNIRKEVGTAITYADSSTLGASFTINEAGVYSVGSVDGNTSTDYFLGISVNSSTLTTGIESMSYANGKRALNYDSVPTGNSIITWTGRLAVGDVVRPHSGGNLPNRTDARTMFWVVKTGN